MYRIPDELLAQFNRHPAAKPAEIRTLEHLAGRSLPADCLEFLRQANGGGGFVGSEYLILYRAEELIEFNAGYEVAQRTPELFLFGSNGGGEGFFFDMRSDPWAVVMVPFIPMELKLADSVAPNFAESFASLARR